MKNLAENFKFKIGQLVKINKDKLGGELFGKNSYIFVAEDDDKKNIGLIVLDLEKNNPAIVLDRKSETNCSFSYRGYSENFYTIFVKNKKIVVNEEEIVEIKKEK